MTALAVRGSAACKGLSGMQAHSYPSRGGRVKQSGRNFDVQGLRGIMAVYVVTGGAGFIGSHLVDALLREGHEVRVIDDLSTGKRENLDARARLIVADICDVGALTAALDGAAGCFHLAAIASVQRANEDWVGTHRVNLTGSLCVFDACRAARLPVVYASSAAVYGNAGDRIADEGLRCAPQTARRIGWGVHRVPTADFRGSGGTRATGERAWGWRTDAGFRVRGRCGGACKNRARRRFEDAYKSGRQECSFLRKRTLAIMPKFTVTEVIPFRGQTSYDDGEQS